MQKIVIEHHLSFIKGKLLLSLEISELFKKIFFEENDKKKIANKMTKDLKKN